MNRLSWLRALALIALVSSPGAAWARREYPDEITRALVGPEPRYTPPCSVCHLGGKTSGATVFTPFAWAMRLRGLSGRGTAQAAILRVQADHVDSDGDGSYDADEIINGTDPNNAGTAVDLKDPQLGCQVGGGAPVRSLGASMAVAVLAFIWRRRRRDRSGAQRRSAGSRTDP